MPRTSIFVALVPMIWGVVGACAAAAGPADDLDKSLFSFSGFGTLGVVRSSENQADFTSSILLASGAGHSRRWSGDVDSRLGGQVRFNAAPGLTAVLQVIAEQRYDNSYTPTIEWANVKYQVSPDFSLRAGRIALPNFLAADYRKVGYAIPWVRTPGEVYGLVPISNSDGMDASYRLHVGDVQNTLQGSYGKTDVKYQGGGEVNVRNLWGVSNTTDYGAASVRVTYLQANVTIAETRPLFDAFRQFGPPGIAIAEKYDADRKLATFVGIGASYDPGAWFVMAEHGKINMRSYLGDQTAWYVSGGYRLGNITPYLVYAQVNTGTNMSDPGLPVAALPPEAAPLAAGLNAGLNKLLGSLGVQKTVTVGARWDWRKNAALKLQYDRIRLGAGSPGLLINVQPGFAAGGSAHVFSAVLDFVF